MGSSTWSDKTSVTPAPTGLTDDNKKEIMEYCNLPENEDVPYNITAKHFSEKFGVSLTSSEIFDIVVTETAATQK